MTSFRTVLGLLSTCWIGLLLLPMACDRATGERARAATVARPADGIEVPPGAGLQQAVDAAPDGAVLLLRPGVYEGVVRITRPITIWGPPTAVVRGTQGSTVRVAGNDVSLLGFTVSGSGRRFDLMDGGVHLQGHDLLVQGLTVRETLFGILVEQCQRVELRGNHVIGSGGRAMGLRGDGIRLWETTDSLVVDNVVEDARDMVVWYSSRNHLNHNTVTGSRYGTHFMYSNDCVVEHSRYVDDEVGIFIMYSRDIRIRGNLIARAAGAAGIGLGLKESGNLTVEDNWFLANTTGIYVDNSPLNPDHHVRYARNVLRFSENAISLHSGVERTQFVDNEFRDNGAVIKVGGHDDATEVDFAGNYFDTYAGYDLDGDGRGDVPFEFRRLSTQLEGRHPELALLHGSPAMAMVDLVGTVMPLFQPSRLMEDSSPRVRPVPMSWTPEAHDAR